MSSSGDPKSPGLMSPGRGARSTRLTAAKHKSQASFAERKAAMTRSSASRIVEGDQLLRDIDRGAPGDPFATTHRHRSSSRNDMAKQRSSYFEDAFSVKETNPIRERVHGEAVVMAEVKTNVVISDEFTFITEFSYHLSMRYQRPVSSIVVCLQHGTCMLYGGTFEPAYIMTISTLESQLRPTTNKRNAALIQKHMEEAIGVLPSRGLLRFVATAEENMASNCKTVAGAIEELERERNATGYDILDDAKSIVSKRPKTQSQMSARSFGTFRGSAPDNLLGTGQARDLHTPGGYSGGGLSPLEEREKENTGSRDNVTRRRKSFVASIFGKSSRKSASRPSLP